MIFHAGFQIFGVTTVSLLRKIDASQQIDIIDKKPSFAFALLKLRSASFGVGLQLSYWCKPSEANGEGWCSPAD